MAASVERELKFHADSLDVEGIVGERLEERRFTSVYYDTDDAGLFRAGLTLRRRVEGGRGCWQLKVPHPDGRVEIEALGGPALPPDKIQKLLRAALRGRAVGPVATMRTHRSGRVVGGALVTLDRVEVLEGSHVVERFAEVEAELIDGDAGGLAGVERRLRQAGARPTDGRSKLARVLRGKLDASGQPGSQAPALDHLRAYVRRQLDEIVRHDPAVRIGGDDAEAVHEMRVAVRRLRAVLRVARPMLQRRWADELRAELDWVAKALGPVRDLDVLSAYLTQEVTSLDTGDAILGATLLDPLAEEGRSARAALMVALESDRYLAVLDSVEAAAEAPPVRRADLSLEKMAKKEFRKLRDQMRSLGDDPSSADLHKARIRGKRARYAAELASITAGKRAWRFVKAAKEFQDALGEAQDAVVTERKLRELVQINGHGDGTVAAGRLIERQDERKSAARACYPKSWKRLKRAGKRAWN